MKLAIMQPYFIPYLGYWQLFNAVDKIIIYDNIKYTKKGWINRNRLLFNKKVEYVSLPLKKDSDFLNINERYLSDSFQKDKIKLLRKIKENYRKAEYFEPTYALIEEIFNYEESNLFLFLFHSIKRIVKHLNIDTEIIVSSKLKVDHSLKASEKVLEMVKTVGFAQYVNLSGGRELYSQEEFKKEGVDLFFIENNLQEYKQFGIESEKGLSIIDVLMFCPLNEVKGMLNDFKLVH